jgi:pre-mRNA-splicing factor 18
MDFLAAEIARKRKEIAATVTDSSSSPNKKFIRRKDIAAEREKRYQEEQERLKAEREAKAAAKLEETRKREAATRAREERLKKEKDDKIALERSLEKTITDEEVIERLRELGEPKTLFAETPAERKTRLEDAEMKAAVERKKKARLEAAKQDDTPELEPLENLKPDAEELQIKLSDIKKNPNKLYDQLYRYFKVVCQEWAKSMDERDPEVMQSPEGIEAFKVHQQCLEDFRPLFRALKRKVRSQCTASLTSRVLNPMSFRCSLR